jgi:hypothetical protein
LAATSFAPDFLTTGFPTTGFPTTGFFDAGTGESGARLDRDIPLPDDLEVLQLSAEAAAVKRLAMTYAASY